MAADQSNSCLGVKIRRKRPTSRGAPPRLLDLALCGNLYGNDLVFIDAGGAAVKVPFTWKFTGWFVIGW
jgi:hypothetical protein